MVPGIIFEQIGQTKFANGYIDVSLDLRSTEHLFTNLNLIKTDLANILDNLLDKEKKKSSRNVRSISRKQINFEPPPKWKGEDRHNYLGIIKTNKPEQKHAQ